MEFGIANPPFSVIIPAYNEEKVIARTLGHLLDGWGQESRPAITVVCNGCRDRTAEIARQFDGIEVVELDAASKTGAINKGLSETAAYPVIIVDGDIRINRRSLEALADALRQDGVMAASPSPKFEFKRSGAPVRAYYRKLLSLGYLDSGVGGSGVYGFSEAGARAIGTFPQVTGDDTYVRWFFPLSQQRRLPPEISETTVELPRRLSDLLSCEVRWQSGNRQLRAMMKEPADDKTQAADGHGARLADSITYWAVKVIGRLLLWKARARGKADAWGRDLSSREA